MNMAKTRLLHPGIVAGYFLLAALMLIGCGYRFAAGEESVDPAIRTVFVDVFTNKTGEAHAENIFRTAFINRFVQSGRFKLGSRRGEADAVCRGTIRSPGATDSFSPAKWYPQPVSRSAVRTIRTPVLMFH